MLQAPALYGFARLDAAAAVKANPLRAVTVMGAVSWVPAARTLTVPVVTTTPDQELVVPEPLTVLLLLLESVNFQLENVAPDGGLFTVQVVLLPRVTDEGEQVSFMTLSSPLGHLRTMGHVLGLLPSR